MRRSREALASVAREPAGVLRIAAAPVLGEEILAPILATLVSRYPRLAVDARLAVDYVDLRRGDIDVALRAWPVEDASDLFAVRLGESITGCWASPAYLSARGVPRAPADLASHECIAVGSAPQVIWTFDTGRGRIERVRVGGRVRVDSFRLARDLAAVGAGIVRTAVLVAAPS